MKLSKAQQEVVDKMREGYRLHHSNFTGSIWLRKDGINSYITRVTFNALRKKGVVKQQPVDIGRLQAEYRLTEQYKTKQK